MVEDYLPLQPSGFLMSHVDLFQSSEPTGASRRRREVFNPRPNSGLDMDNVSKARLSATETGRHGLRM